MEDWTSVPIGSLMGKNGQRQNQVKRRTEIYDGFEVVGLARLGRGEGIKYRGVLGKELTCKGITSSLLFSL